MTLEAKTVSCDCGHTISMTQEKVWCEKCNRPVFYYSKDKIKNTINTWFIVAMICGAASFLIYVFLTLWESWMSLPAK